MLGDDTYAVAMLRWRLWCLFVLGWLHLCGGDVTVEALVSVRVGRWLHLCGGDVYGGRGSGIPHAVQIPDRVRTDCKRPDRVAVLLDGQVLKCSVV